MGIRFEPRAPGQTHVDVRFTFVRGQDGRECDRHELDPALLAWTADANDGSKTMALATALKRVQEDKAERIAGLFGVGDPKKARSLRLKIRRTSNSLCVDVTEQLVRPVETSAARIRTALRNTCNLPDSFDFTLKDMLKYSPPMLFLFDLTGKDAAKERKYWCDAIADFMREDGSAMGGIHHALVILPHRHRFDGREVDSYFDDAIWFRTDPLRADQNPDDPFGEYYRVTHRLEDLQARRQEPGAAHNSEPVLRAWLREELEARMAGSSNGLTVIRGNMGTGKSVLMGELLPRWFDERGVVLAIRGFNASSGRNPHALLLSLCHELLWRLGWDGLPGETADGQVSYDESESLQLWFGNLLSAASGLLARDRIQVPSEQACSKHWAPCRQLLIAIDALDECEHGNPAFWIDNALPRRIPQRIHVLVSSRPGFVNALLFRRDAALIELSKHAEEDQRNSRIADDVTELLEKEFRYLRAPPDDQYCQRAVRFARGNMLCAALVLRYLRLRLAQAGPGDWEAYFQHLEAFEGGTLGETFHHLSDLFWDLANQRLGDDRAVRETMIRVTGVLAIAAEPVSARLVAAVTERSEEDVNQALGPLTATGLATAESRHGTQVFKLPTLWFRETLKDPGVLCEGVRRKLPADQKTRHSRIGQWCIRWDQPHQSEADRTYRIRHALHHLMMGGTKGDWSSIYELLIGPEEGKDCGRNFEYLEARMTEDDGPYGLVGDFGTILNALSDNTCGLDRKAAGLLHALVTIFIGEQHTFSDDHGQLFPQVYSRLLQAYVDDAPAMRDWATALLASRRSSSRMWLRRLTPPIDRTLVASQVALFSLHNGRRYVLRVSNIIWRPSDRQRSSSQSATPEPLEYLLTLKGHTDRIYFTCWSKDGRIATASCDGTCRVWEPTTGECLATLRGHASYVLSASFSPSGDRIITAAQDGKLRVWDTQSGTLLHTALGQLIHGSELNESNPAYSGRHISGMGLHVYFSEDGLYALWVSEFFHILLSMPGHRVLYGQPHKHGRVAEETYRSSTVSYAPKCHTLAFIDGRSNDVIIHDVRDPSRGRHEIRYEGVSRGFVALSPSGRLLAIWEYSRGLSIWELGDKPRQTFEPKGYPEKPRGMRWSPCEQYLIYRGKSGSGIRRQDGSLIGAGRSQSILTRIVFLGSHGLFGFCTHEGSLGFYGVSSEKVIASYAARLHARRINDAAMNVALGILATVSDDCLGRLWSVSADGMRGACSDRSKPKRMQDQSHEVANEREAGHLLAEVLDAGSGRRVGEVWVEGEYEHVLVEGEQSVILLKDGRILRLTRSAQIEVIEHAQPVTAVTWLSHSRIAATDTTDRVALWKLCAGQPIVSQGYVLTGISDATQIIPLEEGRAFVVARTGRIAFCECDGIQPLWTMAFGGRSVAAVVLRARDRLMILSDGGRITMLQMSSGRPIASLCGTGRFIKLQAVSDTAFLTVDQMQTLTIWRYGEDGLIHGSDVERRSIGLERLRLLGEDPCRAVPVRAHAHVWRESVETVQLEGSYINVHRRAFTMSDIQPVVHWQLMGNWLVLLARDDSIRVLCLTSGEELCRIVHEGAKQLRIEDETIFVHGGDPAAYWICRGSEEAMLSASAASSDSITRSAAH